MYFITCFEKITIGKLGWLDTESTRTFGFVSTFAKAEQALNDNACDMHECLYDYAVVEDINQGVLSLAEQRWVFKWDQHREGFFEIEEPKELQHYCNFALG